MKLKTLIPLLFLFIFISSVYAESPFTQVNTGASGLVIVYPKYDELIKNNPFKLHTHVFNMSNGVAMTNNYTSCLVHLYNITGNHVLEKNMGFDTNGVDFELFISSGNFSELGHYSYIIQCNTSNLGGFVSGNFDVVNALDKGQDISYFGLILIPLILAALFFYISNFLGENHTPLKWFLLLLGFITTLGSFRIAVAVLTESKSQVIDLIGTYTYIFGTVLYIVIAYFFLHLLYTTFMIFKKGR